MRNKNEVFEYLIDQLRQQVNNNPYKKQCEDLVREVQSLKNQLRDASAQIKELQEDNIKKSNHISHLTGQSSAYRSDALRFQAQVEDLVKRLAMVAELQETIKLMNEDFNRVTGRGGPLPKWKSYVVGERGPEQSGCRKEDVQECDHNWIIAPGLFIAEGHKDNVPGSRFCCECGVCEWDDKEYKPKNDTQECKHEWEYYYPNGEEHRRCAKCGVITE